MSTLKLQLQTALGSSYFPLYFKSTNSHPFSHNDIFVDYVSNLSDIVISVPNSEVNVLHISV